MYCALLLPGQKQIGKQSKQSSYFLRTCQNWPSPNNSFRCSKERLPGCQHRVEKMGKYSFVYSQTANNKEKYLPSYCLPDFTLYIWSLTVSLTLYPYRWFNVYCCIYASCIYRQIKQFARFALYSIQGGNTRVELYTLMRKLWYHNKYSNICQQMCLT